MNVLRTQTRAGMIVEDEVQLSATELCNATNTNIALVTAWVLEGILIPEGSSPAEWIFSENSLGRAKRALRLTQDLEINTAGVALVIELLDEISRLNKGLA
jgi:chaperone modulatory protein CbpM